VSGTIEDLAHYNGIKTTLAPGMAPADIVEQNVPDNVKIGVMFA